MRTDDRLHQSIRQLVERIHNTRNILWAYATMERKPGEGVLGGWDDGEECGGVSDGGFGGAAEGGGQGARLWAYATMGVEAGGRALGTLEARLEEAVREWKRRWQTCCERMGR